MNKHTPETTKPVFAAPEKRTRKKFASLLSCGTAIALSLVFCLSFGLAGCKRNDKYFTTPESTLPIKDKYALNRYDYDEVSSLQPTLRADILNVTERNLARQEPEILTNDFSLIYDTNKNELRTEYGRATESSSVKASVIQFTKYPSPSQAIRSSDFTAQAAAAGVSESDYFAYYKYMLMTQGQHLAHEASRRSAASYRAEGDNTPRTSDESLTGWLKKHPAADAQYGAVKVENNAVIPRTAYDGLIRSCGLNCKSKYKWT